MGSVAQAVLEFDEAVQVPWRPPLASSPALTVLRGGAGAPDSRAHAARAARLAPSPLPAAPSGTGPRRSAIPGGAPPARSAGCPRCGGSGSCGPARVRLTRRARRLLALVVASGALVVASWLGADAQQDDRLHLVGDASTVVRSGDTLWSIARSVSGDADVRGVVDEIQRLNGLDGTALVPGQVLELP